MEEQFIYDDGIGSVALMDSMGTDLSVVNAARVSFGVTKQELDAKDVKLIKYMAEHRHTSPFEHVVLTCRFVVPLFVRSQHHRHRTWSFNEISRRYTSDNLQFYLPQSFRTQHKNNRQATNADKPIDPLRLVTRSPGWGEEGQVIQEYIHCSQVLAEHTTQSLELFNWMIEAGVGREQARMVLPQNLYTSYIGTVDLHNLMSFVDLRSHVGAQWEIQKVAEALQDIARSLWPHSVSAIEAARQA